MRLTYPHLDSSFVLSIHTMRKLVVIIIILIVVLNAAVFLPNLTATSTEEESEIAQPTLDIEPEDFNPLVLPNLVKF